jgi:hypothetical protein
MTPQDIEVLEARFDALEKRLDERHQSLAMNLQKAHNELLAQARATNGRVTSLERWKAYSDGARAAAGTWKGIWSFAVAGGIVAAITTLLQHFVR